MAVVCRCCLVVDGTQILEGCVGGQRLLLGGEMEGKSAPRRFSRGEWVVARWEAAVGWRKSKAQVELSHDDSPVRWALVVVGVEYSPTYLQAPARMQLALCDLCDGPLFIPGVLLSMDSCGSRGQMSWQIGVSGELNIRLVLYY